MQEQTLYCTNMVEYKQVQIFDSLFLTLSHENTMVRKNKTNG